MNKKSSFIAVGGGEFFIGVRIGNKEYEDLSVLDISFKALERRRVRMKEALVM